MQAYRISLSTIKLDRHTRALTNRLFSYFVYKSFRRSVKVDIVNTFALQALFDIVIVEKYEQERT